MKGKPTMASYRACPALLFVAAFGLGAPMAEAAEISAGTVCELTDTITMRKKPGRGKKTVLRVARADNSPSSRRFKARFDGSSGDSGVSPMVRRA